MILQLHPPIHPAGNSVRRRGRPHGPPILRSNVRACVLRTARRGDQIRWRREHTVGDGRTEADGDDRAGCTRTVTDQMKEGAPQWAAVPPTGAKRYATATRRVAFSDTDLAGREPRTKSTRPRRSTKGRSVTRKSPPSASAHGPTVQV
ncbi:hypothetical protein C8Q77DRAFT_687871 [Trametes polyzona]|nr:hypothetical protein C8Q77DRAFT_687871 [Trametes polyzona]